MTTDSPSVTILILNWNGRQLLPRCLAALQALEYPDYRVVVADNGSSDDSLDFVRETYPEALVVDLGQNLGFARGNNAAFSRLADASDILVLLNNDVYVRPGWLKSLVEPFADPQVGITGAKLLFPDETHIQHAGAELEYPLALSRHYAYQQVDGGPADECHAVPYVTGASMAIRWSLAEGLGLFDERFTPNYYEEADLCTRASAAGYKVLYVPTAVAIHHESFSAVKESPQTVYAFHLNRLRFVFKHYTDQQLANDFIPAELTRLLTTPQSAGGLESIRRAYLELMLELITAGDDSERYRVMLAALGQWWEASLRVDPEHVPGLIYGKPALDPLFRKLQVGWRAFSTKVLFWPVVKRQRATNALLWRTAQLLAQNASSAEGDEEIANQIAAIRKELRRIGQ
ncbi:MAG: glycosyltransferase family 2 protein [Chloroflexota bacterium]|nr:MAG: glycosyltransferase family 2 protein [Chloroflexota bacterium]